MASVDFMKLKDAATVKAIACHNSPERRELNNHSNKHIDKSRTCLNTSIKGLTYDQICQAYDDRIAYLDARATRKPRRDRVSLAMACVPAPEGLPEDREEEWFREVFNTLVEIFGEDNVIEGQIHRDEVHEYVDAATGEKRLSRTHMHVGVIPEKDGRLCAKNVIDVAHFRAVNSAIHKFSVEKYGVPFMDGTQAKSRATVESLKAASELKAAKAEAEQIREAAKSELEAAKADREAAKAEAKLIRAAKAEAKQILEDADVIYDELIKRCEAHTKEMMEQVDNLHQEAEKTLKMAQNVSANTDFEKFARQYQIPVKGESVSLYDWAAKKFDAWKNTQFISVQRRIDRGLQTTQQLRREPRQELSKRFTELSPEFKEAYARTYGSSEEDDPYYGL